MVTCSDEKRKCFELASLLGNINSVNNAQRVSNTQMQNKTEKIPTGHHVHELKKNT